MNDANQQFLVRVNAAKQLLLHMADALDEATERDVNGNWGYFGSMGHVLELLKEAAVTCDSLAKSNSTKEYA